MANVDVRGLRARVRRQWFADGIQELLAGGFIMLWGAFQLTPRPVERYLVGLVIPAMGVWLAFRGRQLVVRVKERVTFPRMGYAVERHMPLARQLLAVALMFGLIALLGWTSGLLSAAGWKDAQAPLVMLVVSVGWIATGLWFSIRRFVANGLLALGLAVVLPLTGASATVQLGWFMVAAGAAFAVGGGLRLRQFLRHTAPPPEA